jgi:hypothetical protein
MKENNGGVGLDKFRKRTLDFDKIQQALPGLNKYREPTEQ